MMHSSSAQRRAIRSNSINYLKESHVNIHLSIVPMVSLVAGILILVMPKLLNYIIALYLIAVGLIGIFGAGRWHL